MGKLLGLDHGDKRFGIALSDAGKVIATPRRVVEGVAALWDAIGSLVEEEDIEAIVLGLPLNMDGSEGPRARKVIEFSRELEKRTGLQVYFWDERLSSFEAESALGIVELAIIQRLLGKARGILGLAQLRGEA